MFYCIEGYQFIFHHGLGNSRTKKIGESLEGNIILELKKSSALGPKGSTLELPFDQEIFETVRRTGAWALEESKFLAKGLNKAQGAPNSKTALLDIGAHCGLSTLQAMNLSNTTNHSFLFEPNPKLYMAIKHNLRNLTNIHINNFGLDKKNSTSEFFTEITNTGNTSAFRMAVPKDRSIKTRVKLVDVLQYSDKYLNRFNNYVIKCDTQGMDAAILSRIPLRIWQNCEVAVIEVWALPEVRVLDVNKLLRKLETFDYVAWSPKSRKKIDLKQVLEFWT